MMWIFSAMMFACIYKLAKHVVNDYFQQVED